MRTFWLFNRGVSDCDLVHREDLKKKKRASMKLMANTQKQPGQQSVRKPWKAQVNGVGLS